MDKGIRLFPGIINFQEFFDKGAWINPNSGHAITNEDGSQTVRVRWEGDSNFNLSQENQIDSDFYVDKFGETHVVYADGNNNAKVIKVPQTGLTEPESLFPSINTIPKITVERVNNSGGNLRAGTYFFAAAYIHEDKSVTNFYDIVGPVFISQSPVTGNVNQQRFKGDNSNIRTTKSIDLSIPSDSRYKTIQIAVIPIYDGVIDAIQLLPEINMAQSFYTYTGNESFRGGSLEEIQIDKAFYKSPKTVHVNEGQLYIGNLKEKDLVNYQRWANKISVKPVYESGFIFEYVDSVSSVYKSGYKRGEVYAFYISWILKEGGETPAFHIPGRPPSNESNSATYQIDAPNDETMGVFVNSDEFYPNTSYWNSTSIGGNDLRNKRVRHHMFPTEQTKSIHDTTNSFIGGFKLENVELPEDLKDNVLGYKVYYAKRTEENKRYLDQALAIRAKESSSRFIASRDNASGMDDVYYLHPFNYMRKRKNISNVEKIRIFRRYNTSGDNIMNHVESKTSSNIIKDVEAIAYLDGATIYNEDIFISLLGFNFQNISANQRNSESKIIVELEDDPGNLTQYHMFDLFTVRNNLYNSFDQQILVSTNYIHTDLDNLDSGNIFGGDIYICPYAFKAHDIDVDTSPRVHVCICESTDNIYFRGAGENPWEIFYPYVSSFLAFSAYGWKNNLPLVHTISTDFDVVTFDNYLSYNPSYEVQNEYKFPTIFPKFERTIEEYPQRVIRNSNGFRTFLPDDYIDLDSRRGELTKLTSYNNILIPHMERALVRTRGKEDIQIGDIRAFLGTGDIFSVKPDEIVYTEEGFAGLRNIRHSISTNFGYFFFDGNNNRVYSLTNDGLSDISDSILPDLRGKNITFCRTGFDPFYERILFTFNNQTLSYSPKINNWVSEHDYIPDHYFNTKKNFYTSKNNTLYLQNSGFRGEFYEDIYDMVFVFSDNINPEQVTSAMSLMIHSEVYKNGLQRLKTFNEFRIQNSWQDTGVIPIVYFADDINNPYIGNARRTQGKWFINQFRDISNIPNGTPSADQWAYMKRLEDHYHLVELIKDNTNDEKILLFSANVLSKPSIR